MKPERVLRPDAISRHRNLHVDCLRGISIIAVLMLHFTLAFGIKNSPFAMLLGLERSRALLYNGNYGVTLFFVISGFLITSMSIKRWKEIGKIDPVAFYVLRFARIIPSLVLVLLIIVVLGSFGVPYFSNTDGGHHLPTSYFVVAIASILTFWHNVLMQSQGWFNYCLNIYWSLSVEEVFYMAFPLLCVILRRNWLFVLICLVLIIYAPAYRVSHIDNGLYWECGDAACFDAIAFGCLTALLARSWYPTGAYAGLLRTLSAIGIAITYFDGIDGHETFGFTVIALFASTFLLASTETRKINPMTVRMTWLLRWMGRYSYELYLFHIVVLALMRNVFVKGELRPLGWGLWLVLFVALSAFAAYLVARFVSEPTNLTLRTQLLYVLRRNRLGHKRTEMIG